MPRPHLFYFTHPADALLPPKSILSSSLPSSRWVFILIRRQPTRTATNFTRVANAWGCAIIRGIRDESGSLDALPIKVATAVTPAVQSRHVSYANTSTNPHARTIHTPNLTPRPCTDTCHKIVRMPRP